MAQLMGIEKTIGCPSGLQIDAPQDLDPEAKKIDLSGYVDGDRHEATIDLVVHGAHCGGCVAKIERHVFELEGVTSAHMNLTTMRLQITWQVEKTDGASFIRELQNIGYSAAPYEISQAQSQVEATQKELLKAMAVAGFAAMNVMLMSIAVWTGWADMKPSTLSLFHWASAVIALPVVVYSGRVFFRSAWYSLRKGQTNMDVPISLALILACGLSIYETIFHNPDTYFDAALMLLFLLLIGRYLDARLRRLTGEAAEKLIALQARSATRIKSDGSLETVTCGQIQAGDTLLISAGQSIPVDGKILEGISEINNQIVTGEAQPEIKRPSDKVYSGAINLTASLKIKALSLEQDSFLAEISKLVAIGEQGKSRFVKIADRAARLYVPVVHSLAALTFIGWMFIGADLRPAALNSIAVLIITCPCALGLAVPAVQIVASGRLFERGILLKSGDALERLAKCNYAVFDKTGTLTQGRFSLKNRAEISDLDLQIAAALGTYSNHPIARALRDYAPRINQIENVEERAGEGITGTLNGITIKFGIAKDPTPENSGFTESHLIVGDRPPVVFLFQDNIRPSAKSAIAELQRMGIESELLSGDKETITRQVANDIGLRKFAGRVTPKEKAQRLDQMRHNGFRTLMVGDGINDAPALAQSYVSASLACGSDISRAAADIILQGEELENIPYVLKTARIADRRVKENLGFAVLYNFCAIPLAVFGLVNPLIAALAMSGSSLIVTLNALRMRQS